MVQFYLLSILMNILIGIVLISSNNSTELDIDKFDYDEKSSSKIHNMKNALEGDSIITNETFALVCGAIGAIVGFVKLFFAYSRTGHGIPVIGDLLPAVAGLLGGGTILLEYYSKSFAEHDLPDIFETVFFNNKKYIGFVCMIIAIIHFIIPNFIIF